MLQNTKKTTLKSFIVSLALVLVACAPKGKQPALKAQDFDPNDREKSSMLVPPAGTWPKNIEPYLYRGKPILAGEKLKNPYKADSSEEFKARGQRNFNNYCLLCHGPGGAGDGQIAAKFVGVKPPSLLTDKIKNYPDGRIFHIITDGQGLMGAHVHQMPKGKDRWAVVNYIRSLQRK